MGKSFVGMGVERCPVSGDITGECVLIDRRMKSTFPDSPNDKVFAGWKPSEETETNWKNGLVAFVEISNMGHQERMKLEDAERTGRYFWMSKGLAERLFQGPPLLKMNFIDVQVGDYLVELEKNREDGEQ